MRNILINLFIALFTFDAVGTSLIAPRPQIDPNEILWFHNFKEGIFVFRGNGMLQYESVQQRTPSESILSVTDYAYPTSHLLVLAVKTPLLVHVRPAFTGYIIDVYSLNQSKKVNHFNLEQLPSGPIYDLKGDPNQLTLGLASNTAAYTISLESGMVVSHTPWVDEYRVEGVVIETNSQTYITFYENRIIGLDKAGKILWKQPVNMNSVFVEPFPCGSECKACIAFWDYEGREDQFQCLNPRTGAIIWGWGGGYQDLRGLSRDGLLQAWFQNGQLNLTNFPNQKKVTVSSVQDMPDVMFSATNKIAYCLPALTAGKEDLKSHTYPLSRKSQKLQIIDCISGSMSQEVDLTQSKPRSEERK